MMPRRWSDEMLREQSVDTVSQEFDAARDRLEEARRERDETMWTLDGNVERAQGDVAEARRALHRKLGIET